MYADRFWKRNWDEGLEDLKPEEYETTYVAMINKAFEEAGERGEFLDDQAAKI